MCMMHIQTFINLSLKMHGCTETQGLLCNSLVSLLWYMHSYAWNAWLAMHIFNFLVVVVILDGYVYKATHASTCNFISWPMHREEQTEGNTIKFLTKLRKICKEEWWNRGH